MAITHASNESPAALSEVLETPEGLSTEDVNGRKTPSVLRTVVEKIKRLLANFFYTLYIFFSGKSDSKRIHLKELEKERNILLLNLGELQAKFTQSEEKNEKLRLHIQHLDETK